MTACDARRESFILRDGRTVDRMGLWFSTRRADGKWRRFCPASLRQPRTCQILEPLGASPFQI